jgi:hypothetical protein
MLPEKILCSLSLHYISRAITVFPEPSLSSLRRQSIYLISGQVRPMMSTKVHLMESQVHLWVLKYILCVLRHIYGCSSTSRGAQAHPMGAQAHLWVLRHI